MIYFDTNVLIYASVNQNADKMKKSQMLFEESIKNNQLIISPLVIQEYVYTLNRLKLDSESIYKKALFFIEYCKCYIDSSIVTEASLLACKVDFFSNINDIVHLKTAENYCTRLITFDSDFNKLIPHSKIEIEIIT